ncbi:hypothetical protein pRL110354 (plasmid) [Rhizobium johnstonii 3841]|uniref:Uncharacterized protein n=1 Tax=Rhizobium johnstonii (strain DSM 114642 / LMG 32736 / 3841) TaxID=216596 RepID=Q1M634_RHIJ3|nr:hypothetical protein pRL110354 [Rhizobium johnstonii 3841]
MVYERASAKGGNAPRLNHETPEHRHRTEFSRGSEVGCRVDVRLRFLGPSKLIGALASYSRTSSLSPYFKASRRHSSQFKVMPSATTLAAAVVQTETSSLATCRIALPSSISQGAVSTSAPLTLCATTPRTVASIPRFLNMVMSASLAMTISCAARGAGGPPDTPHLQLNGRETPKFPSPIQRTFQEEATRIFVLHILFDASADEISGAAWLLLSIGTPRFQTVA